MNTRKYKLEGNISPWNEDEEVTSRTLGYFDTLEEAAARVVEARARPRLSAFTNYSLTLNTKNGWSQEVYRMDRESTEWLRLEIKFF